MAKHSFQHPSVPASAPTSPTVTRGKTDRNHPATPQRVLQRAHRQLQSSPYTPATSFSTPFTPLSLRSFSTSSASSLATPVSSTANRHLSLSLSPEESFHAKGRKGAADFTDNWRNRANENGIRVGISGESHLDDDEDDEANDLDTSNFFSTDKALLPAPFLSTQRRARAFTQALPQAPSLPLPSVSSPVHMSTPARAPRSQSFALSPGFLNTPPPNPDVLSKFRLRGTVTDPAQTRRRPAFEQISELCDIDEDEYMPYAETFCPSAAAHLQSRTLPLHLQDPFDISSLSGIYHDAQSLPAFPAYETPFLSQPELASTPSCSVCGCSSGSLAVLDPCTHPLCSGCLTSALNIVGEKDMECAVCKAKVNDFKLQKLCIPSEPTRRPAMHPQKDINGGAFYASLEDLPPQLDVGFQEFIDRAQGSSTPVPGSRPARKPSAHSRSAERVVLRIDNVPWDITPPAIAAWLKQPVERVHVLLDRKGKTLSHAFAEMASPDAAKIALRTSQNSVLGKGKRARGVTVTRSNQEELMRALFPSWQGTFDGARPSLSGLDNEHVIAALQHGLISDAELRSLLHLIRSPDSPFLKVPSLPFHSVISILSKIPSDDDSKVFWSGNLRDMLYEITHAAVTTLVAKIEGNPFSDWTSLMTQVVRAAMECQAFTAEQMSRLSDILEAALPRSTSSPVGSCRSSQTSDSFRLSMAPLQSSRKANGAAQNMASYRDLAKEFGVGADVVEALVQRLSDMP